MKELIYREDVIKILDAALNLESVRTDEHQKENFEIVKNVVKHLPARKVQNPILKKVEN